MIFVICISLFISRLLISTKLGYLAVSIKQLIDPISDEIFDNIVIMLDRKVTRFNIYMGFRSILK